MRKLFALAMVAFLALTVALAAVGCGQKKEAATPAEMTPPAETAPMDTSMQMSDTSMADTSMHH